MSDFKDIIKQDFSEAELAAKGWIAKFSVRSFSGRTLAIAVGVAFLVGLLIHFV